MAAATKTSADTFRASIPISHRRLGSETVSGVRREDSTTNHKKGNAHGTADLASQRSAEKENQHTKRDQHNRRDPAAPTPNLRDERRMFDQPARTKTPNPDEDREHNTHEDLCGQ